MTFICHVKGAPTGAIAQLAALAHCCAGAMNSPLDCTCWEIIYDAVQVPPDPKSSPTDRDKMCDDCAYRPDSPERTGDAAYQPAPEPGEGTFWCHQGMRRAVFYRHPSLGITVAASTHDYDPPIRVVDRVAQPYRADGTAGQRCAGWVARRRADGKLLGDVAAEAERELADDGD